MRALANGGANLRRFKVIGWTGVSGAHNPTVHRYGEVGEFVGYSPDPLGIDGHPQISIKFADGRIVKYGQCALEEMDGKDAVTVGNRKDAVTVSSKVKVKVNGEDLDSPPGLVGQAGEYDVDVIKVNGLVFLASFGRDVGGTGKVHDQWWVLNRDVLGQLMPTPPSISITNGRCPCGQKIINDRYSTLTSSHL